MPFAHVAVAYLSSALHTQCGLKIDIWNVSSHSRLHSLLVTQWLDIVVKKKDSDSYSIMLQCAKLMRIKQNKKNKQKAKELPSLFANTAEYAKKLFSLAGTHLNPWCVLLHRQVVRF